MPVEATNRALRRAAERKKHHGICPVCGKPKLDVTPRPDGRGYWISCWPCEAAGLVGAAFLRALLDAIGAHPGAGGQLLEEGPAFRELQPYLDRGISRSGDPEPLPSLGSVAGWASALLADAEALDYLTERRGLSLETVELYELGFDRDAGAITIPIRDAARKLANLRRRALDPEADPKIWGLYRRGTQLYPVAVLDARPRRLVVAEGELDCLLLNSLGFTAVTGTGGAAHWKPEWTETIAAGVGAGALVAVVYDADATAAAERRAEELRAAGLDAFAVDLNRTGHHGGKTDVTDLVTKHGWTAARLRQLINLERTTA